ncbi:hypothetical protein FHR24_003107 [Wenyingzhuangia heitensis]|uniref:Uncharacterized protein n=1 Tax=Wenyingzhuangia heitensis TaxID=1487859 RepID=A0ABX0UCS2_9FLAO|nr:hypothetical protein [Wenyingzhuangia heitensis]
MLRKIGFFILSLWLLFVLIIIITFDFTICFKNCEFIGFEKLFFDNITPAVCLIFLFLGMVSFLDFLFINRGSPELSFEITEIENIEYENLTFLTTYIIPLVCFNFDNIRYVIVFIIILIVIGAIYIRTDLFYSNPTLALLQYRIYKVNGNFRNDKSKENLIIITRTDLSIEDRVSYIKLDNRIYFGFKI